MNISLIGWSHLGSLIVKNLRQPWHKSFSPSTLCFYDTYIFWLFDSRNIINAWFLNASHWPAIGQAGSIYTAGKTAQINPAPSARLSRFGSSPSCIGDISSELYGDWLWDENFKFCLIFTHFSRFSPFSGYIWWNNTLSSLENFSLNSILVFVFLMSHHDNGGFLKIARMPSPDPSLKHRLQLF